MDFHLLDRVAQLLCYFSPQDTMVRLVEEEKLTPSRAYVIIKCAQVWMEVNGA